MTSYAYRMPFRTKSDMTTSLFVIILAPETAAQFPIKYSLSYHHKQIMIFWFFWTGALMTWKFVREICIIFILLLKKGNENKKRLKGKVGWDGKQDRSEESQYFGIARLRNFIFSFLFIIRRFLKWSIFFLRRKIGFTFW